MGETAVAGAFPHRPTARPALLAVVRFARPDICRVRCGSVGSSAGQARRAPAHSVFQGDNRSAGDCRPGTGRRSACGGARVGQSLSSARVDRTGPRCRAGSHWCIHRPRRCADGVAVCRSGWRDSHREITRNREQVRRHSRTTRSQDCEAVHPRERWSSPPCTGSFGISR